MKRYYVFRTGEAGDTFDADYEPDALGKWVKFEDAQAEIDSRDARIAELEADRRVLQSTGEHPAPCARHCEANAFRIELRDNAARIRELEDLNAQYLGLHGVQVGRMADKDAHIAELEKQAAIDKTLLALADARINRELRDDFAGRAMQGLLAQPGGGYTPATAYAMADEMLKAKGGT